jgi:tRNA (guanine-N7-)-methyltransferase
MPPIRVRQHVNPLSQKYQVEVEPPDWQTVFAQPHQPLLLDLGCGKGIFVTQMAQLQPDWNFLGLEIRQPVVDKALALRDQLELTNAHFLFCNANISLRPLLASLPAGVLQRVAVQFPDPWFKKRHQKRRVVQPELVQTFADYLPSGGQVILQSDVEALELDMCDRMAEHPAFARQGDWLDHSPFPAQTDREVVTLERGDPVYRACFVRR